MKHARADYDRIQDPAGLIPEDEPVFLLRAKDVCAIGTIDAWVQLARRAGASRDIIRAARNQRNRVRDWQLAHGSKVPDLPREGAPENE